MTTFQPGDIVRHPEHGAGVVYRSSLGSTLHVAYADRDADGHCAFRDLIGWERVETCTADERRLLDVAQAAREDGCGHEIGGLYLLEADAARQSFLRPGHVQVRVDDLDLSDWVKKDEAGVTPYGRLGKLAVRAATALAAQNHTLESHKQPASATVTLPCPDCGENITSKVVVRLDPDALSGGYYLGFDEAVVRNHRCPPAQPDEPTSFGARIQVTNHEAETTDLWVRIMHPYEAGRSIWVNEDGTIRDWAELCDLGTIQIGWDD